MNLALCRVEVGKTERLERCGRYCARGLAVCWKHLALHGRYLDAWVRDWYRTLRRQRPGSGRPRRIERTFGVAAERAKEAAPGCGSFVVVLPAPRQRLNTGETRRHDSIT